MADELTAYGSISFVYENGAEFTEGSGNGFAVDVTVHSVFAGQTLTVDLATAGDIHTATFPESVQITID